MPQKHPIVILGAGLIAGLVLATAFLSIPALPRASAQPPSAPSPRFSISSWGYAGSPGLNASHGLYIIDHTSGKVWTIEGSQAPTPIGQIK